MKKHYFLLVAVIFSPLGCMAAAKHHKSLPSTEEQKVTVGIMKKEIRYGMSQTAVA
jgi:hypothetical protein